MKQAKEEIQRKSNLINNLKQQKDSKGQDEETLRKEIDVVKYI